MSKGAKLIFQLWADLECMRTFAFAIVRLCEGWGMRLGVGWVTLTFGIVCVQAILRWNTSTAIRNFLYNDNVPMTVIFFIGSKFLSAPNQDMFQKAICTEKPQSGQKSGQRVQNSQNKDQRHPSCCGNPPILSSELLWESTVYSTHLLFYNVKCFYDFYLAKSPEVKISIDTKFHFHFKSSWTRICKKWIPTVAPRTELVDSHSRSLDRIDGFPQ